MTVRGITSIFVSWRDGEEVGRAVGALAGARDRMQAGGPRLSLVVVDNGGDVPAEALRSAWPGAILIANPENRGFGPAANQGAAAAPDDVLLFLNPDTRAEGEPFTPIARAFEAAADVVAVAPRLIGMEEAGAVSPSGTLRLAPPGREDQATFQLRRLPTLRSDARELSLLDHLRPDNPGRRWFRYADADRSRAFPVEQAAAAALAVRKDAFDRIGGFDESFAPAWHEDVDLCERLGREGTILYLPEARFRHRGGDSAGRLGYDRFLPIFYRNALRYRARRYAPAARLAYRALLAGGMLLRLAALAVRRDVPRPRPEAARAYLRVLAVALTPGPRP